jgi:putative sterol carrier protein
MVTGQLKVKGTLPKIMRYTKAAIELVNCTTKVETDFPG